MNISYILSFIAILLTVFYTFMLVNSKNRHNYELELILLTLLTSILWCVYGYINNTFHICIGYLIVVIILTFFIIQYHL
jgi:hypothetical protein